MARPCSLASIQASIQAPAACRSLAAAVPLALLSIAQSAAASDDTREREHLAAIVRQIDMLDRLARQSSAAAPSQRSRYYFDYRRLDADIRRIRAGVTDYLNPPRAQPRDPSGLDGQYRRETSGGNTGTEAGK